LVEFPGAGLERARLDELRSLLIPGKTSLMHGEDDQVVPFANTGPLSAKLLKNATTRFYPGFTHGMPTTHADQINADPLAFVKEAAAIAA
jgi:non-heme chloroperoxidase